MSSQCTTTFNVWCLALLAVASVTSSDLKEGDVAALVNGDHTEFTLITAGGWVRLSVGDDWKVPQMDTKEKIKTALFQIPNKADKGASNSANLSVTLYEIGSYEAGDAFRMTHLAAATGARSRFEEGEVFAEEGKQDNTNYAMRTAFRDVADVHVAVRLFWLHLSENPANYDSDMEQILHGLLKSVTGDLGAYQRRAGETARRPK
jgi:hypothetical protein